MRLCTVRSFGRKTSITFYNAHKPSALRVSQPHDALPVEEVRLASVKRAVRAVDRLFLCNHWDYFVTLTISPALCPDRTDPKAVKLLLQSAFDRLRKAGVEFRYLLVPDYHSDGSIHFHGFFSIEKRFLTRAGNFKLRGRYLPMFYSPLLNKLLGRNSFRPLVGGPYNNDCLTYCLKYVRKAMDSLDWPGALYLCSHGLKRVTEELHLDASDAQAMQESLDSLQLKGYEYDFGVVQYFIYAVDKLNSVWARYFAVLEASCEPVKGFQRSPVLRDLSVTQPSLFSFSEKEALPLGSDE